MNRPAQIRTMPRRVLDIGCGDAQKIKRWALQKPGWQFEGNHVPDVHIARIPTDLPSNVHVKEADTFDYTKDKPDEHYSMVTSDMHIGWYKGREKDPRVYAERVTSEAHRLLAPGGQFKVITLDGAGDVTRRIMEKAGFRDVTQRQIMGKEIWKTEWTLRYSMPRPSLVQVTGIKPK